MTRFLKPSLPRSGQNFAQKQQILPRFQSQLCPDFLPKFWGETTIKFVFLLHFCQQVFWKLKIFIEKISEKLQNGFKIFTFSKISCTKIRFTTTKSILSSFYHFAQIIAQICVLPRFLPRSQILGQYCPDLVTLEARTKLVWGVLSIVSHSSAILPSSTRMMLITANVAFLPVGAIPSNSPW